MKKLILLSLLLLFSGCTVDYNITIKNNNSVYEETNINGQKVKNSKEFESIREGIVKEYRDIFIRNNYKYEISNNDNIVKLNLSKKSSIETFYQNSLYKELFENGELFNTGNKWHFKTIGSNYMSKLFVTSNFDEKTAFNKKIDKLRINIKFEGKVIQNNADKYDKETNTYTWIFTKYNCNKGIKFSYDSSIKVVDIKGNGFEDKKTFNFKHIILAVILVVIVSFMVAIIMISKNRITNKI